MKRFPVAMLLLIVSLAIAGNGWGDTIHESATMGAPGIGGGVTLSNTQFLGSRFHVDTTVQVEEIGGHIVTFTPTLFGAIVSLSGPGALPSGSPFDGTTMASTTFDTGFPSVDFLTPLSVTLPPGDYALIFGGADQFGATGAGAMPSNNTDLPGASYFFWSVSQWNDGGFISARFVVNGQTAAVNIDIEADPNPVMVGNPLDILLNLDNPGGEFNAEVRLWVLNGGDVTSLLDISPVVPAGFVLTDFVAFSTSSVPAALPSVIGFVAAIFDADTGALLDFDFLDLGIGGVAPSAADINALRQAAIEYLE